MVAVPLVPRVSIPVAQRPFEELHSPEARAEMLRVVRGLVPDRSKWPELMVDIIRSSTFEEWARFCGDDGGMDYELIYWAIQEAEATDPVQAMRWCSFKSQSPSRLNIRPPLILELSQLPPDVLPPGIRPPRVP
ncbi:hypothetical protein D1007_38701 [Hordeum vulgare]|nr:hypothetical protein D1007_38701 [Hordeum vulgare]